MVTTQYRDYLKSHKWWTKRLRLIAAAQHRCAKCGQVKMVLQVHHLTYERIFNELDTDLMVLCRPCHRKEHHEGLAQTSSSVGRRTRRYRRRRRS